MATQKQKDALPHDELTKLLDYDPETGEFTWKPREGDEMSIKTWNGRQESVQDMLSLETLRGSTGGSGSRV